MNEITTNQTTFPTLFDLFQHWVNVGYPDYVTGIWSNDGSSYNLTLGVTNDAAGEAGKQEILDQIEDDASVTFVTQTHPHNYLMQIQDELLPYFKKEGLGMVSSGLDDRENHIEIEFLAEKANNEATLDFIADLYKTYGDAISVSYTDGYCFTDELLHTTTIGIENPLSPPVPGKSSFSPLLVAGLIGIPLVVFGLYFVLRKRFVPVVQRNNGGTVAQTDSLSVKEVEELVKESSLTVSREVDEKVMERIGKIRK